MFRLTYLLTFEVKDFTGWMPFFAQPMHWRHRDDKIVNNVVDALFVVTNFGGTMNNVSPVFSIPDHLQYFVCRHIRPVYNVVDPGTWWSSSASIAWDTYCLWWCPFLSCPLFSSSGVQNIAVFSLPAYQVVVVVYHLLCLPGYSHNSTISSSFKC